jgi:hypothetical protein
MAETIEEIDRADTELLVLHDVLSWRDFHELALRRAGFGQVVAYPAHPSILEEHLSGGASQQADLIVYGIVPTSEDCWENLGALHDRTPRRKRPTPRA